MKQLVIAVTIIWFIRVWIPEHRLNKQLPKDARQRAESLYLSRIRKYLAQKGYRLIYPVKSMEKVNGNSTIPGCILISGNCYEGAYSDNKDTWICAFISTICHELGHKDNEPKGYIFGFSKERRFINYFREVRADLYGKNLLKKDFLFTEENAIKAFRYKRDLSKNPDKRDDTHPSWNFRYKIVNKYDEFCEDAIYDIADYTGLDRNNSAVKDMITWFETHDKTNSLS